MGSIASCISCFLVGHKIKPLVFVLTIVFLLPLKCRHTNAMAYAIYKQVAIVGELTCRQINQFVGETTGYLTCTFTDSSTLFI